MEIERRTKLNDIYLYVNKKAHIHTLINSNTQSEKFSLARRRLFLPFVTQFELRGLFNVTPLQVKKKDNFAKLGNTVKGQTR